jgi:hypothetical protein
MPRHGQRDSGDLRRHRLRRHVHERLSRLWHDVRQQHEPRDLRHELRSLPCAGQRQRRDLRRNELRIQLQLRLSRLRRELRQQLEHEQLRHQLHRLPLRRQRHADLRRDEVRAHVLERLP